MKALQRKPPDAVFKAIYRSKPSFRNRSSVVIIHSPNPKHHITEPKVAASAHVLGLARALPPLFFPLPRSIPKGRP